MASAEPAPREGRKGRRKVIAATVIVILILAVGTVTALVLLPGSHAPTVTHMGQVFAQLPYSPMPFFQKFTSATWAENETTSINGTTSVTTLAAKIALVGHPTLNGSQTTEIAVYVASSEGGLAHTTPSLTLWYNPTGTLVQAFNGAQTVTDSLGNPAQGMAESSPAGSILALIYEMDGFMPYGFFYTVGIHSIASGAKMMGTTSVDLTNYTLDSPVAVSPTGTLNSLSVSIGHAGSATFIASLSLSVVQGNDSTTAELQMTSIS